MIAINSSVKENLQRIKLAGIQLSPTNRNKPEFKAAILLLEDISKNGALPKRGEALDNALKQFGNVTKALDNADKALSEFDAAFSKVEMAARGAAGIGLTENISVSGLARFSTDPVSIIDAIFYQRGNGLVAVLASQIYDTVKFQLPADDAIVRLAAKLVKPDGAANPQSIFIGVLQELKDRRGQLSAGVDSAVYAVGNALRETAKIMLDEKEPKHGDTTEFDDRMRKISPVVC